MNSYLVTNQEIFNNFTFTLKLLDSYTLSFSLSIMNIISLVSYPFLPARSGGQKGIALFYKYFSSYHSVTIVTTKKNEPAFGGRV